ncbi:MAG: response regulator transcription factor [Chitinophagales bacterium]
MQPTVNPKAKILLAEDDANLSFVLKDNLERKGYEVSLCKDGVEGIEQFAKENYDLCLFDIMMPKMDGITMAEKIRVSNHHVPIIFVSAKSLLDDKLAAFKIGGDDYLIKPFSMDELLFKVDVFLRRSKTSAPIDKSPSIISIGKYQFDFPNLLLTKNKERISLTMREGEVLRFLVLRQNQLVPREELLKQIWGRDDYFLGRSLDVFISRLRKYLKEDPQIAIENIHGVGFRLVVKS